MEEQNEIFNFNYDMLACMLPAVPHFSFRLKHLLIKRRDSDLMHSKIVNYHQVKKKCIPRNSD